jgi:mannosyltransferase
MRHRFPPLLLPMFILLIAFGLRIFQVAEQNYTWDEGFSNWLVDLSFQEMIQKTADDVHPPLYYIVLRGMKILTGETPFTTRFPSVLIQQFSF